MGASALQLLDLARERDAAISAPLTLTYAALCADPECGIVFDLRAGACPTCSERNWLSLARILDREKEPA